MRRPWESTADATSAPNVVDRRLQRADLIYRSMSLEVGDVHCPLFHRLCGPEERAGRHTILLVRTGLFTMTTGRDTVVADPNHVLFFSPDQPYRVAHPVAGGDTSTFISLRASELLEVVRACAPGGAEREDAPAPFTWGLSTPYAYLRHHELLAGLRRGTMAALAVEEIVFDLVHNLLRSAYEMFRSRSVLADTETGRRHRSLVEAAKILIDKNVETPPSLGEIAGALGCSPFHLSRMFHRESGLSMRRYLDRCRLRLALERLAEGENDLTTLALDLGYAHHSHFTNAFHREFGTSPSRFRLGAHGGLRAARKSLQA